MQQLQGYLVRKFQQWQPQAPEVVERTKRSVTLKWLHAEPYGFMRSHLLYKVQRKEKIPAWVTVYSGGKTMVTVENLAPSHPHKFRLQVILKSTAVRLLAEEAVKHYGDENAIRDAMETVGEHGYDAKLKADFAVNSVDKCSKSVIKVNETIQEVRNISKEKFDTFPATPESPGQFTCGNKNGYLAEKINDSVLPTKERTMTSGYKERRSKCASSGEEWLQTQWSDETWTSTDTDGTSATCFCMGVRCGYFKQVQVMLEERPVLIGAINSLSGLTPLATAVKKGDVNTVKFVLSLGAEVDQATSAGQVPLHLAVLEGHADIVDALLEKGANFHAQDLNGLRVEHYAVDSCKLEMVKHVMDRGGDVTVQDSNGWTPLFRAVCQGARSEVIEELLHRGSSVDVTDRRGLALVAAARLLRNRQGHSRDSVLRLVDAQFPHEKALANFTRLTKKIYSVHTLLK